MPVKMSPYQEFIHRSRYARWVSALNRRENWQETVGRYIGFFASRIPESDRSATSAELERAILELETMPSMRALMTAGPALQKDNVAGYNCSFLVVDDIRAFDEAMYISMCFHPDTLVRVKGGVKPISQIEPGDWVLSKDETGFFYQPVADVVENPTENRPKVELEFSDGSKVKCSEEHEFLTRRGYVAAKDLTSDDDIEEESVLVYSLTNIKNGKIYVGYTTQGLEKRFAWHCNDVRSGSNLPLHRAIRKYGSPAFKLEILEDHLSLEKAQEREKHWIRLLGSLGSKGYNCTPGGEGTNGYRWTDEQKRNKPKPVFSPEFRLGRSVWMKAHNALRVFTPAYRKNLSEAQTGEKNHQYGRAKSEEIKAMLSRQNSGGGNPSARPVIVGDQRFSCLKQAALELGISRDKIYSLLKKGTAQYASR